MIIIGYPGIGKTTLASLSNKYLDLESSLFNKNKEEKIEDWYIYYCRIAIQLSEQGYDVLISSHSIVINYLIKTGWIDKTNCICIYPALSLKKEWIKKLEDRYKQTKLSKDERAYQNVKLYYTDQITILNQLPISKIELKNINYSLRNEIINFYLEDK